MKDNCIITSGIIAGLSVGGIYFWRRQKFTGTRVENLEKVSTISTEVQTEKYETSQEAGPPIFREKVSSSTQTDRCAIWDYFRNF